MRWFSIRARTTTSASASASASRGSRATAATLLPTSGNCRGASGARAASMSRPRGAVVVDVDSSAGVDRLRPGLGDDQGDQVTDERAASPVSHAGRPQALLTTANGGIASWK